MLTPAGLADIKTYADGIGPWKPQVLAHSVVPYKDGAGLKDVNTVKDTGLIRDAHKAGLIVHSFTFRNEPGRLADRKSTRLNSSHLVISYAVFCLKTHRE